MSAEALTPAGFAPIREHLLDYGVYCLRAAKIWGADWFAPLIGSTAAAISEIDNFDKRGRAKRQGVNIGIL